MSKKNNAIPDEMILVPKELIDENNKAIATLEVALEDTQAKYDALLRQVYGCSSEKSSGYIQNDSNNAKDNTTLAEKRKKGNSKKNKGKNGGGRKAIEKNLPKAEPEIISLPNDEILDETGKVYDEIGFVSSFVYDIIEAKVLRKEIKRIRYGYKDTGEVKIIAPVKKQIIPKGKLSDNIIFDIVYAKYILGLPLHRQSKEFKRFGANIGTSLLSDMVKKFSAFFAPIAMAILSELLKSDVIHIDETTMKEFNLKHNKQKYIWLLTDKGGNTYCHYGGRGYQELRSIFDLSNDKDENQNPQYSGTIVTDAYSAYDKLEKELPQINKAGCMAHARRKFIESGEGMKCRQDVIGLIQKLYIVESNAKKYSDENKLKRKEQINYYRKMRQEKSVSLMEELKSKLLEIKLNSPQGSSIIKASNYMLHRWQEFELYLENGEIPIDNNLAERSVRPIVIGRKNFLFVGSEQAGEWTANCYTILSTIINTGINPKWYLQEVAREIHQGNTNYHQLTPKALLEKSKKNIN